MGFKDFDGALRPPLLRHRTTNTGCRGAQPPAIDHEEAPRHEVRIDPRKKGRRSTGSPAPTVRPRLRLKRQPHRHSFMIVWPSQILHEASGPTTGGDTRRLLTLGPKPELFLRSFLILISLQVYAIVTFFLPCYYIYFDIVVLLSFCSLLLC